MSSENSTYYSRSMSGITEISDGTTTISDGNITSNSLTTDTITTNTLSATYINTYSITSTSGTFIDTTTSNIYIQSTLNYINSIGSDLYFTQKIVSNAMKFLLFSPLTSFIFSINGTDALTITATNTK